MAEFSQITFTPRYPRFSYFLLETGREYKVLEYEDHLEVSATDRRGRWRPRRKLPSELAKYWPTLRKYDLTLEPREPDEAWVHDLPRAGPLVGDAGEVRDPAFIPRKPNPTESICTEDGRVIWFDGLGRCEDADCFCRRLPFDKSLLIGR